MVMDSLKPCPFCGGDAKMWQDPSHSSAWFCGCDDYDCFGNMQWGEKKKNVIAAWNRRALSGCAEGYKCVPVEPSEEMMQAGALHEWSGGYDRQGSHASGKYEEYTESLRYMYGDVSSPFAAAEVYRAMIAAAPDGGEAKA